GGHSCPRKPWAVPQCSARWRCSFVTDFKRTILVQLGTSEVADKSVRATRPMFPTRTYQYRRRLPHFQKFGRALFVTFCKLSHDPFSDRARDLVLKHCIYEHGRRIDLYAAVIMPDHVHILFTPLRNEEGWPFPIPQILKMIKGTSARDINRLHGSGGPVWQDESFDHVLRSQESLEEKMEYIRMNPVRAGLVYKPGEYRWLWMKPSE